MESKIIIKNPDVVIHPLDSASVYNYYVVQVSDSYYKLDEDIVQILLFIDKGKSLNELKKHLIEKYNTEISLEKTEEFVKQKLIQYHLVWYENEVTDIPQKDKKKSYIRFRLTLLQFDFLKPIVSKLTFLFQKYVFKILNFLAIIVLLLVLIPYKNQSLSSLQYLVILFIVYAGTLWHEFGHITACYYYGVKPRNIGFGFYIIFPVLYSEVTSVWLLNRKQRMIVNYGGIYFQFIYIIMLYLLSSFVGKIVILKAIYFIIISFIPALNPILRFDGYWLFSDLIGVDNLRDNTTKVIKYYKNKFFGKSSPVPDVFSQYSANKIFVLKFYMLLSLSFLLFFYYIIMKEVWIIMKEIWQYLLMMYKTSFTEFRFNWEFGNIAIKLIIVSVVLFLITNRIVKK